MPARMPPRRLGLVHDIGLLLALGFLWAVVFVGPSALIATAENDATTIGRIAAGSIEAGGGNYALMALLYAGTAPWLRTALVLVVGSTYLWLLFSNARGLASTAGALAISLPASVLGLSVFQKDLTSFALVTACYLAISASRQLWFALLAVVLLYLMYGIGFRTYYLIIIALFCVLGAMLLLGWLSRIYVAIGGSIGLLLVPHEVWTALQQTRDNVNIGRVGSSAPGANTAFYNLFQPDGLATFVPNYLHAVVRLNFGWLTSARPQEFALAAISVLFLVLAQRCWRLAGRQRLLVLLFAAHVLTLFIFEPDLGSYLRHMTTAALYLSPGLGRVGTGKVVMALRPIRS